MKKTSLIAFSILTVVLGNFADIRAQPMAEFKLKKAGYEVPIDYDFGSDISGRVSLFAGKKYLGMQRARDIVRNLSFTDRETIRAETKHIRDFVSAFPSDAFVTRIGESGEVEVFPKRAVSVQELWRAYIARTSEKSFGHANLQCGITGRIPAKRMIELKSQLRNTPFYFSPDGIGIRGENIRREDFYTFSQLLDNVALRDEMMVILLRRESALPASLIEKIQGKNVSVEDIDRILAETERS